MPFDGSGFDRGPEPEPSPRHPGERVLTIVIAFIMVLLFVLPVSAASLVDIAHAVMGR